MSNVFLAISAICFLVSGIPAPFLVFNGRQRFWPWCEFLSGKNEKERGAHTHFYGAFPLRGEPFWIWFLAKKQHHQHQQPLEILWFMTLTVSKSVRMPASVTLLHAVQDPEFWVLGSGLGSRISGFGGCCFVNTQYEFQFPSAWTLRTG